jgi:hypothetical protein
MALIASADATAINNPNGSGYTSDWNATGYMSPIGVSADGQYVWRARIDFNEFTTTGITSITNATLKLWYYHSGTSTNNAGNSGNSTNRTIRVYLANNTIVNTGGGTPFPASGWTSKSGYNWETQFANGTFLTTPSYASYPLSGVIANNTPININVTSLMQWVLANKATFTFRGFLLRIDDESAGSTSSFAQVQSIEGSNPPQLEITSNSNTAPNAPTNLSPTGGSVISNKQLSGTFSDPDAGDTMSKYQVQIASDSGFTTIVQDSGEVTSSGSSFAYTYTAALAYNTTYYWRARTADSSGTWGPYSSGTDTFKQNTKPNTPTGLTPTGSTVVPNLTPTLSGSASDPDSGDYIALARIRVYRASDNVMMWDSGDFASGVASFTKQYGSGGTTYFNLSYSTTYYWTAVVKDSNGTSSSTSSQATFVTDAAGVTDMTPATSGGTGWVKTLTPSFNFTTPSLMNQYSLKIYDTNGTLIRTIGPTAVSPSATTLSTPYTYAGTPALEWGTRYQWSVVWRDTSNVTQPESAKSVFWTNSAPVAQNISPTNNQAITSINPQITARFSDQDLSNGFTDSPTSISIEVSRSSDSVVMYTMTKTAGLSSTDNTLSQGASGVTTTAGAGGTTLTKNVQYRYRSQYIDNSAASNATGSYSEYVAFKPTDGPTISSLAVDASDLTTGKINNPLPLLSYTYTGAFSKAQKSRRLRIIETSASNAVRYDSGFILTSSASFDAPENVILNNATYKFEVTVTDSDDVESATISATYLALWDAPAIITGLYITQGQGSLVLHWNQSSDASFVKYNIYRKTSNTADNFTLVTSIDDIQTIDYVDFSSGIGAKYEYKITQTSQPAGSNAVDSDIDATPAITAASESDNWWIVYEDNESLGVELYVNSEDRTNPYQEEVFEPFGRGKKVVVRYGQYGVEGNISAYIPHDETAQKMLKIKELFALAVPLYLKTPFGDVYKVYFGTPSYQYSTAGTVQLSVSYIEVD